MTLERAIEVFVRACSQIRSQFYPCLADRIDGLWMLHDAPGRKDPRKSEVIAWEADPGSVVERVRDAQIGWHSLCHLYDPGENGASIRTAYKALGYRALASEWMFVHDLREIPLYDCDPPVRLVPTQAEMDAIPQTANHKLKLLAGSRQFVIHDETRDYGFARSVPVGEDAWVSNLYVRPDVRGKGYGRAIMSGLLQSDRENGVRWSVLLASSSGARLYPHLGYKQIATLQMFCPRDRAGS